MADVKLRHSLRPVQVMGLSSPSSIDVFFYVLVSEFLGDTPIAMTKPDVRLSVTDVYCAKTHVRNNLFETLRIVFSTEN